jgi:filamentous hemagglutinin family protein
MFYSASSTNESRFGRVDRAIARGLVGAILLMTPLSATAGEEFQDANQATFDNAAVRLDNALAGQTNFTIDTGRTIIEWQDFQQPENNTLDFNFSNAGADGSVLNRIGSQQASHVFGTITSNGEVILANPFGVFLREGAIVDVGSLVAVGANVGREDFMNAREMTLTLGGSVTNDGLILANGNISLLGQHIINRGTIESENGHVLAIAGQHLTIEDWDAITADFLAPQNFYGLLGGGKVENQGTIRARNAALLAGRIVNTGEIEITDGTLLMAAADAVWVTQFDNPVLVRIPHTESNASPAEPAENSEVGYAIENHGLLDAGLGHVRLAAADPLGFAIRQGTGTNLAPARIAAKQISLEGSETGRVHLSGEVDASDASSNGVGGEIEVSGSMIVLEGADIRASGTLGGGTIQIGGEREGRGEMQRARLVLVDRESEIRADALLKGNGGQVIVFAEDLTSVDGAVSARGGLNGGDGGFVETSGLRNFLIHRTPDVTAPAGSAGEWLIDPFNLTIGDTPATTESNLNNAILAILSPSFDPAVFDGILRTVSEATTDSNGVVANLVSAELIADALATGTNVTLSTQAFGLDRGSDDGNIYILSDIRIDSTNTIEGTSATLRLLAAGDINVESDIMAFLTPGDPTNLALTVELTANDAGQVEAPGFDAARLTGDVLLGADIRTGGGDVLLSGSSVLQASGQTIDTDGGAIDIRSGTVNQFGEPVVFARQSGDTEVDAMTTPAPRLVIAGNLDTCVTTLCDGSETGGDVTLVASSINVRTARSGADLEQVVTGELSLTGQIQSGGGDIRLSGGVQLTSTRSFFTGNVDIDGDIDSRGGDIAIFSNHVDPELDASTIELSFLNDPDGLGGLVEGGVIDIDAALTTQGGTLSIGGEQTQSIQLDGRFDTTQLTDATENGLIQLIAQDLAGGDGNDATYGQGEIVVGASSDTSILTSSLLIESRDVSFSDGAGLNAVALTVSGSSTATVPNLSTQTVDGIQTTSTLVQGAVSVTGDRRLRFHQNTSITAESIKLIAASRPAELNSGGATGDEFANSETRLTFAGVGGADSSLGVRLSADSIMIKIGDGASPSSDGFLTDLGSAAAPTDDGLQRLSRASYSGLQLRDSADLARPAILQISQDGDLTILSSAPSTAGGELDLVGAFAGAAIGAEGMRITLESSDGLLTIEDAIGLNNEAIVTAGSEAGKSFVRLNGGLILPISPNEPSFTEDSIRFRDGTSVLGADGTTAFDVESLIVSSAGNFTVRQQIIDGIDPLKRPNELVFESGRVTGALDVSGRGTLIVDPNLTIQAQDRLALLAGASGFGNLIFSGSGTTLAANAVELRAGAGSTSQNTDSAARSSVSGLQANVAIRDARFASLGDGAVFGDTASTATSFSLRQDAAVDAQSELPELVQFGLSATGFRAAGDVAYRVRSDQGNIDLDDDTSGTNEAERFQNANLSLIAVDSSATPAVDVSSDFVFLGKRVELGGIGDFTFTQNLATAFNRTGLDAAEEITLRAGAGGLGNLNFDPGNQSSVLVKAPRINLIAGDGVQVDDDNILIGESQIDARNAVFDLAGPVDATPTFSFNTSSLQVLESLPTGAQFLSETSPDNFEELLPDILAIRTDIGLLDLQDFDVTTLPLDLVDDSGRLILEAEEIRLSQTDGDNLELTSAIANLHLRIRANRFSLNATNADIALALNANVMIGPRAGDNLQPNSAMSDSSFDEESLLIEAFDRDARSPAVTNLSSLSEDTDGSGLFTFANARGPTTISITQDGAITPAHLFQRDAVAGGLGRSLEDDEDGNSVATTYSLISVVDSATFDPENVNGSRLIVSGISSIATDSAINFGSPGTPGVFFFEDVLAATASSIEIQDGTSITASDTISLAAGQRVDSISESSTAFGALVFASGALTTSLTANQIALTAGPNSKLEGPDNDGDGEPDASLESTLPRVDFTGLDRIDRAGTLQDSFLTITQSASLNSARGGEGDFLTPLEAGLDSGKWAALNLNLIQGDLALNEVDAIANLTESFTARTFDLDSTVTVTMPNGSDSTVPVSPFDDFVGNVEFQSNDILFQSTDANTSIDLATDQLSLVSTTDLTGRETAAELARFRDDPEVNNRPIVRIHQDVDFINAELPQPSQYVVINALGVRSTRTDLSGLDIELKTSAAGSAADLTLDNQIRSRTTTANLILDSAGDINFMLDGPTPGFDGLDYADLQLTSLDIKSAGEIKILPFLSGGNPADLSIETTGDQRFSGLLRLENTLSTTGRNIRFAGDIERGSTPTAGLLVATSDKVVFEGDLGTTAAPLDHLVVIADSEPDSGTPTAEFGTRSDPDLDGLFTPDASNQSVTVDNNILFLSYDFNDGDGDRAAEFRDTLAAATSLSELETTLAGLGIGRTRPADVATIGKASGNLSFTSTNGHFVMTSGEKLSVGGTATIDVADGFAAIGDVSAIELAVTADSIGLVRRSAGIARDQSGETRQDGGASIIANTIDFMGVTPTQIGSGPSFRFGLPNPFDPTGIPDVLGGFALFEIKSSGTPLVVNDFRFDATTGDLANQVPILLPVGASRSDLSGAFGPEVERTPSRVLPELNEPFEPNRLTALAVVAQETPIEVRLARLEGRAIINDLGHYRDNSTVTVTTARINARDAEAAIALYEELFGQGAERSNQIRTVLQDALDRYLDNSRARRVVGFELRRFVKNRPSTLLDAYRTLDSLDALFQYHRRLGLSPGEYRDIQRNWLRQIQPDGITLDELSEAIHPSRYVRGSDILDIFGR